MVRGCVVGGATVHDVRRTAAGGDDGSAAARGAPACRRVITSVVDNCDDGVRTTVACY